MLQASVIHNLHGVFAFLFFSQVTYIQRPVLTIKLTVHVFFLQYLSVNINLCFCWITSKFVGKIPVFFIYLYRQHKPTT